MRWTIIDKDDPKTWPPAGPALIWEQEFDQPDVWGGVEFAEEHHGDAWAPLPPNPHEAPPERMVKVRAAVGVSEDGAWSVEGFCGWEDDQAEAEVRNGFDFGDRIRISFVTAYAPMPEPDGDEIDGEVE